MQDAVHSTTFSRTNTSSGRLAEADVLYQTLALQHRVFIRLQSVLNRAHAKLQQSPEAVGFLSRAAELWQDV